MNQVAPKHLDFSGLTSAGGHVATQPVPGMELPAVHVNHFILAGQPSGIRLVLCETDGVSLAPRAAYRLTVEDADRLRNALTGALIQLAGGKAF